MVYGDFKDLARRTADKVLRDKAFNIAKDPKYDGYQRVSWFINFLIRNQKEQVLKMKLKKINNLQTSSINPLLKNSKNEKYIQHSKTIFGMLI